MASDQANFKEELLNKTLVLFFYIVLSSETFDAAGGINQFLLARKEGVAGGTNFNLYILDGGTGFDNIPAGAANLRRLILGVYLLFHAKSSISSNPVLPLAWNTV